MTATPTGDGWRDMSGGTGRYPVGWRTPTSEDRGPIDWPEYRKHGVATGGPCATILTV